VGVLAADAESLIVNEPAHAATVALGIIDERVRVGDHIAYFWHSDEEFDRGCEFLAVGLQAQDQCIAFGWKAATRRVCRVLERRGLNLRELQEQTRLRLLPATTPRGTLEQLASAFRREVVSGTALIRVLGNIEWGDRHWHRDQGLLMFEAKLTAAAKSVPSVIVCMYDGRAPFGGSALHGALKTHPLMADGNVLRVNTSYVQPEALLTPHAGDSDTPINGQKPNATSPGRSARLTDRGRRHRSTS
jgi:hypothetical protein